MTFQNLATRSPQLGSKRVCVACATRFYDMTKAPPVCPKCSAVQPPEVPRARAPVREPRRVFRTPVPVVVEAEEDLVPAAETDGDEDTETEEVDEDDDEAADIVATPERDI